MKINLDNCKTSAQAVTKLCYNEPTRNLTFRVECQDFEDLLECVKTIKAYNDFDWKKVSDGLKKYAHLGKYFSIDNPNNGNDLFTYDIGREGSPVMYIKWFNMNFSNKYQEGEEIKEMSDELFEKNMKALQTLVKADECDCGNDGCYNYCRLWWD